MRLAVVGAGPAGLSFASKIQDVDVFEEHEAVGLPRHCTGLVSAKSAEAVGIPKSVVVNKYEDLVVTDLRNKIYFRVKEGIYLLDRPGLEQKLAERVPKIYYGKKVVAVERGYVYTLDGKRHGPYDYVVLAEGSARRLSSRYGHVVRLPGLQVDVKTAAPPPGITVIYNQQISKAYFAWTVEIDRGLYRVGLADSCCVVEKLRKLLKAVRGSPVGRPFGGGVLAGPPLKRLVHGRVVALGDAAGLVKPLSGGGIVLSTLSGAVAADALLKGDPYIYERRTYLLRLKLRAAFHAFVVLYGMRLVDKLLEVLDGGEYTAVDYDDHLKTLVTAALTDPRAPRALGTLLQYLPRYRYVTHLL
ncbi:MAG: NAD(P)/FAD-dependent oxidoreductase [Pyrobaculum sp.]